jgi:hypothetical protein
MQLTGVLVELHGTIVNGFLELFSEKFSACAMA